MSARALLFDLDGTLVDSARGIAAALNGLRRERGGACLAVEQVRPLVALGADALISRGLGEVAADPASDLRTFRARLAEVPPDRAALYPQVEATLAHLARAGWRMAVVTNKPERLARDLLAGLDLVDRFAAVIGGDSAGEPKPSPAPVRLALAALDAADGYFIGDSAVDAAAARACGLPFLLFEGGYGAADCADVDVAARFASFPDLPRLLAA